MLQHCENSQLRSLYSKTLEPSLPPQQHDATRVGIDSSYVPVAAEAPADALDAFSPRRTHLLKAAHETFPGRKPTALDGLVPPSPVVHNTPARASKPTPTTPSNSVPPQQAEFIRLLMQALGPYAPELREDFFARLHPYFTRLSVKSSSVLWSNGDFADTLYVLESGILRAVYDFPDTNQQINESMLPGTVAGEHTFLAAGRRNATVVAERDCQLWKMTSLDLKNLEEKEGHGIARSLRQVLLRVSAESADGKWPLPNSPSATCIQLTLLAVLMGHLMAG